ncbi:MAG TPA: hypothetical protein PLK80_05290 [bacterium]|nr:MAG: hypothetical protein BWY28_00818 [bacterium ADurb.Bin236]HOY62549.1 hypothetical protein [bacterium]HPI76129.1 hypothetical protein [bacterium]HPN94667.1 hypothetical protein [bacterium]
MKTMKQVGMRVGFAGILIVALAVSSAVLAADKAGKETKKEPTLEERLVAIAVEYTGIHEALAGDTVEHVNHRAAAIAKNADAALKLASKDVKRNDKLIETLKAVKMPANSIASEKTTLNDVRDNFFALSDAVVELVKNHLPEKAAAKYNVFYCPMAKGYWIQTDDKTRNPYHGKEMLRCGRTIDYAKECANCDGKCACEKKTGKCGCEFKGSNKNKNEHEGHGMGHSH